MNTQPETVKENEAKEKERTDAANWAPLVQKLQVSGMPESAPNLVEGRRLVGPLQGFGKMWQKTYRVTLAGSAASPTEIIKVWKERFSDFWPKTNTFYAPLSGLQPGEVALLSVATGPMKLSTGVMVLYADAESFTLMTPQGHMLAGWITFSASKEEGRPSVAQAQVLMRAQDPLSEIGLMLFGHKAEDKVWTHTLTSLAKRFGVEATPETSVVCVDPRRRWSYAKNVWHNAGIRSSIYTAKAPLRALRRLFRRRSRG